MKDNKSIVNLLVIACFGILLLALSHLAVADELANDSDSTGEAAASNSRGDSGHPLFMSPHFHPIAIHQGFVYVTNTAADTLDVLDAESRKIIRRIPVGIDPAGVAIRPDGRELWVTNHVSDSVSIIDLENGSPYRYHVIATLQDLDPDSGATCFDEPVGIAFANDEKAYISLSSENKIAVVDVANRRVTKYLPIAAQDPRALAVRNGKLFVLPFESNNQTQLSGGAKEKIDGKLVTFDAWDHSIRNNNVLSIGHVVDIVKNPEVPDKDLFVFDIESDQLLEIKEGLGTLLYGLAVDSHGNLFIAQTDARNDANGRAGTKKHGLAELENRPFLNRLTRISWSNEKEPQIDFFDLEPLPPFQPQPGEALATPFAIQVSRDDRVVYATASSSDAFFTLDATTGKLIGREKVGAVPEGIEIEYSDEQPVRAWVLNAADNTVSVVDVSDATALKTLDTIQLDDPTPEVIKQGRIAFSTARASTTGTFSCASCHPDGHTDQLLWVLKTPIVTGGDQIMPRSTMPVRGLRDTAPFHWDGIPGDPYGGINSESIHASISPNSQLDRPESSSRHLIDGGLASTMSHVDDKSVNDEGKPGRLTAKERDAMAAFLLSLPYPPAQRRSYTNELSKEAIRGFELFHLEGDHKPDKFKPDVCGNCHRMPLLVSTNTPGTGMDAPTWRGAYDRWLILPQGRLNMVEFDFYRDIAKRGAPEKDVWSLSWGGRPRFNPVWNMVLESSTGFSGGFARQVTLNRDNINDPSTRKLLEALETGAKQRAFILHAYGVQIDGFNSFPISLQLDPSRSSKPYVPRIREDASFGTEDLTSLVEQGKLLITLTAHVGKHASATASQPAIWTLGPMESQRGRQEFPIVNPRDKVMVLSGRHFDRSAKLFIDGHLADGAIEVGHSERVTVTLDKLPANGIHFLQVQSVDGLFSNEFIFHVASDPQAAIALRNKLDEPHTSAGSLRRILSENSSVDDRRDDGSTPLNQAVVWGETDIVKELIERGASVTGTNSDGNSPLHLAAFFARREIIDILLAKGASIESKNKKGETPLDLVAGEWSEPLASLYRQIGVSLGLPIDIDQIRQERPQIVELLGRHKSNAEAKDAAKPALPNVPDDVTVSLVDIMSEGTRMSAYVFAPKKPEVDKLPTIIMALGWGGVAQDIHPDAIAFAKAGFLAVTFDYRGWGSSDARLIAVGKPQAKNGKLFAEVKEVRGVVDPIEQTTDLTNMIHWAVADPRCDANRIGLWGSSFGGGHVIHVAARDPRVKAFVTQVASVDHRWVTDSGIRQFTLSQGSQRSRGEIGYPQPEEEFGNLPGPPVLEKFIGYAPIEDIDRCEPVAKLFMIAENDEVVKNEEHSILAYQRATGIKNLVTFAGVGHSEIRSQRRTEAQRHAIDWFDTYLKGQY